jgi:AbrB family transcriptional regulator (stage V sporulation protein T)
MISDRDRVIAVSGASKKEFMDKEIGPLTEQAIDSRKSVLEPSQGTYELCKNSPEPMGSYVIAPIVAAGDPIGSVILWNRDEAVKMGQLEVKMVETAAGFLAKQMEQ